MKSSFKRIFHTPKDFFAGILFGDTIFFPGNFSDITLFIDSASLYARNGILGGGIIKKNILRILIICVITAVIILYFFDISGYLNPSTTQTGDLKGVEIRNYEGEDLSRISAFRENSIKGTQRISEEDYTLRVFGLVNNTKIY